MDTGYNPFGVLQVQYEKAGEYDLLTFLSGLVGAIIGASVTLVGVLLPLGVKRREERKRIIEVAVQATAEAGKIITALRAVVNGLPYYRQSEGPISIRGEWAEVRTRLVVIRQLYPSEDVRHNLEVLWNKIDECFAALGEADYHAKAKGRHAVPGTGRVGSSESKTSIEENLRDARAVANEIYRQLRNNLSEVDDSYSRSREFPGLKYSDL